LPSAMVSDILSANPQAAKSDNVMQAVDQRTNMLSDEQLDQVNQGKYIIGAKESLEAKLSYFRAKRNYAMNNIIRYYRNDTLISSPRDNCS